MRAGSKGGTVTYMSPEQKWLLTELKKIDKVLPDYAMYCAVKEEWQITPATSDLFQASLTVLEMHARGSLDRRGFYRASRGGPGKCGPHSCGQGARNEPGQGGVVAR